MGMFRNLHELKKQAREMERNAPPVGARLAAMQDRMAGLNQMMAAQTQAASAAAAGAGRSGPRCSVMINGMRQVGTVNFDLLVEFDLTVTPQGRPPYPTTTQQLVSQFQVSRLRAGLTVQATIDPSNPAAAWLDLGSLS